MRDAILREIPDALSDPVLLRYVVFALFATWRDVDDGRIIIGQDELAWINGKCFSGNVSGQQVLDYLQVYLPDFRWVKHVEAYKCRRIEHDGLPAQLHALVLEDWDQVIPPSAVYALSGRRQHRDDPTAYRQESLEACKAMVGVSAGAKRCQTALNERPPNIFNRVRKQVADAWQIARHMPISPNVKRLVGETENAYDARRRQVSEGIRRSWLSTLRMIHFQPQPFYSATLPG